MSSSESSGGRAGEQSVRQRARRATLQAQSALREQRADRERRLVALGIAVTVAVGERDAAVAAWERRAGEALRTMTETEGLTLREAVAWCGPGLSFRDATRLRSSAAGASRVDESPAEQPAFPQASADRATASGGETRAPAADQAPAAGGAG